MLRDYQVDICKRVGEAFDTHRSVMVQMPTGTGKTVVLAELVNEELRMKSEECGCAKVLIVAHRRELIEQIKATIKRLVASPPPGGGIVVESIQTISRRIGNFPTEELENFGLVIIDEAHHALAKTYKMMWKAWPDAKFIGLTATPCRMNGRGFTDLFDVLLQSWDIATFIKAKWLAKYDFVSIKADSHAQHLVNSLKLRGNDGDYLNKEMDEVLNKRPSIELLYLCFAKYAKERKGIVYAFNINHAQNIADYYQSKGVKAVAISSQTPENERRLIVEQFRSGGLQVLVSVDLFSEGFDCPDVEFIQLARPTLSLAKYLQMVGRGLRIAKDKEYCMVIDNVGLYRVFGLPSQVWDWEGMFEGVKADRYKNGNRQSPNVNNHLSLSHNQNNDNEMYLVVNHEQLEQTFESQKEDEKFTKVRNDLLSGRMGEVNRIGRQLVELVTPKYIHPIYVDLVNMHFFRTEDDERPSVVKVGGVEFIRYIPVMQSRTKKVLMLTDENRCTACTSFYSEFRLMDVDESCLKWNSGEWSNGSDTIVFLHDDTTEYYLSCCHLTDGSIVIMDVDGNYYCKREGHPRENIGRADTPAEEAALRTKIEKMEERIILMAVKDKAAKRMNAPYPEHVEPYRQGVKWGLRDSNGRVVAPPIYRKIKSEHDFFPFENLPLHWGVMDKLGKVLIEPKHDNVKITPDGKAIITSVTGKQTIINLKSPPK